MLEKINSFLSMMTGVTLVREKWEGQYQISTLLNYSHKTEEKWWEYTQSKFKCIESVPSRAPGRVIFQWSTALKDVSALDRNFDCYFPSDNKSIKMEIQPISSNKSRLAGLHTDTDQLKSRANTMFIVQRKYKVHLDQRHCILIVSLATIAISLIQEYLHLRQQKH